MSASKADRERLLQWLGGPDTAWLLDRMVKRLAGGQPLAGMVRIADPTEAQRESWARLVGERVRGGGLRLDLDALNQLVVEAGMTSSLEAAVTVLRGPVENRRQAGQDKASAWDLAFGNPPANEEALWADLRQTGLVKRLVSDDPIAGAALLRQAAQLLGLLPAQGLCLQELAVAVVGDAHGLDPGRPLASVVLRAVKLRTGVDPSERRLAWASVGVELDPLSASVLVLGLRAQGDGLVARLLQACADAGEPCRLTLRQLRREPLVVEGDCVFVCENPAVVLAAADRLGPRCRPLVCVEGQPGSAARLVLAVVGTRARYHGDFDWPGVRIAADVLAMTGGQAWRFDAAAYERAPKGMELLGASVGTAWDSGLREAMLASGRLVHEEAVISELLGDLARYPGDLST